MAWHAIPSPVPKAQTSTRLASWMQDAVKSYDHLHHASRSPMLRAVLRDLSLAMDHCPCQELAECDGARLVVIHAREQLIAGLLLRGNVNRGCQAKSARDMCSLVNKD